MRAAYTPVAGSIADRAIKHLAGLPAGTKMAVGELAPILGVKPENLGVNLHSAVLHKALVRLRVGGGEHRARYAYSLPTGEAAAAPPAEAVDTASQVDESPEPEEEDQGGQPVRRIVRAADTVAPRDAVASVFDLGAKVSTDGRLAVDAPPVAPPASAKPAGLNWTPARPLVPTLAPKPEVDGHQTVERHQAPAPASAPALAPIAVGLDCALWNNGELWLKVPDADKPLVLSKAQTRALVHYLDNLAHEPILEAQTQ